MIAFGVVFLAILQGGALWLAIDRYLERRFYRRLAGRLAALKLTRLHPPRTSGGSKCCGSAIAQNGEGIRSAAARVGVWCHRWRQLPRALAPVGGLFHNAPPCRSCSVFVDHLSVASRGKYPLLPLARWCGSPDRKQRRASCIAAGLMYPALHTVLGRATHMRIEVSGRRWRYDSTRIAGSRDCGRDSAAAQSVGVVRRKRAT
jgi:hypothetical protein